MNIIQQLKRKWQYNMHILVTGGFGFIGHHVARQLRELGHDITTVDIHHQYGEYQNWEYY